MRWRRVALFAAIVVGHVLVILFFPAGRASHDNPDEEISLAILMVPEPTAQLTPRRAKQSQAATTSTRGAKTMPVTRGAQAHDMNQDAAAATLQAEPTPKSLASINWAKEAQIAADNSVRQDDETSRQAVALSLWRSSVMPSPSVPEAPQFRWTTRGHTAWNPLRSV